MFSKSIQRATLASGLAIAFLSLANGPVRAIVDGNPVSATEQQDKGLVILSSPSGTCSGVLIVNDWVLTAGHCAIRNRLAPKNIQVALNGVTIAADAVYLFGGYVDEVGPDLALMHLSAPFNVNGSTTGFRNQIWSGAARNLIGKTVASYGQGRNVCAGRTGSGTYRAGDFVVERRAYAALGLPNDPANPPRSGNFVERTAGPYYQLLRNANGRIHRPGDSGGPSFIFENGTAFLTGIQSGGDCVDVAPGMSPAGSGNAYQVSLASVRTWIEDVFKSQWSPGVQSQSVYVYSNEVIGTKWTVTNVNSIPWAQAARAAAAMCYNRGFAGGHFDGHQGAQPNVAGKGFGLQCSGGDTQWFDVRTSDMDPQWRFSGSINDVNWAQAGRTAERYCATRGFVGGQFNGHQRNGRYGVFCYRGGAQGFDASDAELAATGWGFPTPRLDDNAWAQAGRAATGFCRAKGFSGGFMNGHQLPNRYGVVCQQAAETQNVVKAQGRIKLPRSGPALSICEAARKARARNSPAAPGLEAQCRNAGASGELPPPGSIDLVALQARGAEIANDDSDAGELRDQQRYGASRRGFEIGLAASEGQTLQGPGKQRIHDLLNPDEQNGFTTAVNFTLSRNRDKIGDSASRGEEIANDDPLAVELRDEQGDRAARTGFDIGMAAAEGQTLPGPGKQRIRDSLSADKQLGFDAAVTFSLDRNRNKELADTGAEIATRDRRVARARAAEPDAMHRLGFDIATGIFGDPALGARGNTAKGPGSLKIRDGLSPPAREGFDASMDFHLRRN